MEIVERLLDKAFTDIKPYYIGVFVKGKTIASRHIKKSEKLEESFSRMVEYSTKIDDAISNFKPEFLFSDGKDFSIMIYYVDYDIAVGIIYLGKSNFSLLKITAQDIANELKKYEKDLLLHYEELNTAKEQDAVKEQSISQQNDLDELEKVLTTQTNEIITKETAESIAKEISEKDVNITVPSLEDILFSTENTAEKSNVLKENIEETNIAIPSLEDILSIETQNISTPANTPKPSENNLLEIDKILNEMEKEFVKIVGPFGKYIFKSRKNELLKKDNIAKSDVSEFIRSLTEDIPEIEKRDLFLKNINSLLVYIL